MFRASSCSSSGATTTAVAASGLPSGLGDRLGYVRSAVRRGLADRHIPHAHTVYLLIKFTIQPDDGQYKGRNM
jgi:hypothetical protein